MADSNRLEKLLRNMSNIPEEDVELDDLFIKEADDVENIQKDKDKPKLSLKDSGLPNLNIDEQRDTNFSNSSTVPENGGLKEADNGKAVRISEVTKLFDLYSKETTPHTLNVDLTVHCPNPTDTNNKNTSTDSTAFISQTSDNSIPDSSQDIITTAPPRPLTLPFTAKEPQSSAIDTPSEVELTGRRQFRVLNVDESVLKNQNENVTKELDAESDVDNQPLLEKRSNSLSDSEHSTLNAHFDTIGPLENPQFLKMLNYSVSRATNQGDGLKGVSNLDLANFTSPSSDMDGGWAWVVLFAAFFSLSLTGATTFAAGVLMSAILQIDPDITKASWIGAVHISVLCMSGPFVGIVLNRLGARLTAFIAGLVLSGGLIAASRSDTIIQLIFTHGLIAGMGSGFILNTMFVTVGQYFNRYRGLACGLLATGSGMGMLAGGNALTVLYNNFGLRGTYMLWGGVTLHSLVFAMLLRPSPAERLRDAEKARAMNAKLRKGRRFQGKVGSLKSGSIYSERGNSLRSQRSVSRPNQPNPDIAPLLKAVLHKDMSKSTFSVTNQSVRSHLRSNLSISNNPKTSAGQLTSDSNNDPKTPTTPNPLQDQTDKSAQSEKISLSNVENTRLLDTNSVSEVPEEDAPKSPSSPTYSRAPSELNRTFRKRLISGSSQAPSQYTSTGRLSYRPSIREQLQRNDLDNESLASTLVSHLQPHDALNPRYRLGSRSISSMFGSIASLPTALVIIKDDLSQVDTVDGAKKKTSILDSFQLLKNKPFLVFISTCLLWALADSPFSMYLPAYTMSKGSTREQASSLYTGMGFGSMCGRFLSGLVASDSGIGPVLLHIGCLSIASLVVGFSPWITSTYLEQMLCAALFGLYTGSLVPLSSLITIELLGIGDLGLGFGFLSLAQGIGYLAGPPLLGMVIQVVGFEMGFRISAVIFLSASLLAMMIAVLIRKVDEEDIHDSFDDLERALNKISDSESEEGNDEVSSYQEEDQSTNLTTSKSKEQQAKSGNDASVSGGGSTKKEPKLKPSPEPGSPTTANDLGIIAEEA